jgi:hypothetical protein
MVLIICALFVVSASAQQKPPELTGALTFDVDSESGRVERIAVQIGDGGSGKYKAILAGDSSLPTHAIYRPRDLKPFGVCIDTRWLQRWTSGGKRQRAFLATGRADYARADDWHAAEIREWNRHRSGFFGLGRSGGRAGITANSTFPPQVHRCTSGL